MMRQLILIIGMAFALTACSSIDTKIAEKDIQKPIYCPTAEGDIRVLNAEKAHTSAQIAAKVSAIEPISLVIHSSEGNEKNTMKVASGDYNKMIDEKIAQIKVQCGIE